ncbi:HTTM domain-containing protein [Myxococcota bacterium]|nr:HTTM domain-containing protein [Myxococcota bacterium]
MIRWWVGLWDRREAPTSLAVVRILVGALILVDLLELARLDLVVPLYAPRPAGGMAGVLGRELVPELYRWLPATAQTATAAFWLAVVAAATFTAGLSTRLSAVVLLLLLAQLSLILPPADRGIDMLLRNALMVLAFSRCGAAGSVDARLRAGRWSGDGQPVPSWPRYLLVVQLAVLYTSAGMQKVASAWLPPDWSALWVALRDPHFQRGAWPWVDELFVLTQAATAITWLWEWLGPVILLAFWYRDTPGRPGRLRAAFRRYPLLALYLGVGALFHLGTHLGLRLGIFPFAVLSLYPAAVHPETWGALFRRLRGVPS